MNKENKEKQTYSGDSIASKWLSGTWLGNLLGYPSNTYIDGYGTTRNYANLEESAQGQQLSRMKDTAKNYGKVALTGMSFGNPLVARSTIGAVLPTGAQSYFITEGLRDAYNRFMKKDKTAEDAVWTGLDLAGAIPAVGGVVRNGKYVFPEIKYIWNRVFPKSTLNWDPENWFAFRNSPGHIQASPEDISAFNSHIKEYKKIERRAKRRGDYLKLNNGKIFTGDPREWVVSRSKAAKNLNFDDYFNLGSGQKSGYTTYFEMQRNAPTMIDELRGNYLGTPNRPAWLTEFNRAKSFALDNGYTYRVFPQKNVSTYKFDANGSDWDMIPGSNFNKPGYVSTNYIVNQSPADIVEISNVSEGAGGINNITNDIIFKGKRKSILGNNGNFDWNDEVIWRRDGGKLFNGTGY